MTDEASEPQPTGGKSALTGPRFRPEGRAPTVFGHRGLSARAPENTLAAFRLISTEGIPGVELDIHQCRSGELVVAHDDTLSRTAGVDLTLREATLEQIRTHDVGSWFNPAFAAERIPTLEEVFELLGESVYYDIEIKPYGTFWGRAAPGGPEYTLRTLIRQHKLERRCLVSSFDPLVLRRFSELSREIPIALIYSNSRKLPVTIRRGRGRLFCKPDVLKPHHSIVTPRYVRRHHARGRQVIPWTVDDPSVAAELYEAGVDGVISNIPDKIMAELR